MMTSEVWGEPPRRSNLARLSVGKVVTGGVAPD